MKDKTWIEGEFSFRKAETKADTYYRFGSSDPVTTNPRTEAFGIGEDVEIVIKGKPEAVDALLNGKGWATRALGAINRCLALLGYRTEEDREKALARFLAWLAFVEAYVGSQDSEAKATWTEAAIRFLGNSNRLTTQSAAQDAAEQADGLLAQQMRRFPPRPLEDMVEDRDTYPSITSEEQVELDAWRHAAKALDCDSPDDVRALSTMSFAQIAIKARDEEWQCATNYSTPKEAESALQAERAENVIEVKQLLATVLNCDVSLPLSDLARGVVEMVAGRERAASTVAEHALAKVRADLNTALREKATLREERDAAEARARIEREERHVIERERDKALSERNSALADAKKATTEWESYRDNFRDANRIIDGVREAFGVKADEYCDLVALAKTAILPRPKPEKVEVGQRWAVVHNIKWTGLTMCVQNAADSDVQRIDGDAVLRLPHWVYLGKS